MKKNVRIEKISINAIKEGAETDLRSGDLRHNKHHLAVLLRVEDKYGTGFWTSYWLQDPDFSEGFREEILEGSDPLVWLGRLKEKMTKKKGDNIYVILPYHWQGTVLKNPSSPLFLFEERKRREDQLYEKQLGQKIDRAFIKHTSE